MAVEQKRGQRIAMLPEERDEFLAEERTCRVATVGPDGEPHNSSLWFFWDGTSLWLNSIVKSQRWADIQREPRISVIVDAGHDYGELRGVELTGRAVSVGDVPRGVEPHPELSEIEPRMAAKYRATEEFVPDGRHAWLRMTPDKIVSWDFRKLPKGNHVLNPADK